MLNRTQPNLSFDLRGRESFFRKNFFNSALVIPLQFNETVFHSSSACKSCLEVARKLYEVDFVRVNSLDNSHLLSVAPFVYLHSYSLLFLGYFFTNA